MYSNQHMRPDPYPRIKPAENTVNELTPTFNNAISFWWAFTWRNMVFGLIGCVVIGALFGLVDGDTGLMVGIIYVWMAFLQIWIMQTLLSKKFADFRVTITE